MATLLGCNGDWGINDKQTGIILESASQTYECDEKVLKNITGDDIGLSHYNERITGSLSGFVPAQGAFTGTISALLVLATEPADHLIGDLETGMFVTKTITTSQAVEDYKKIELNYTYHAKLGDC